MMFGEAKVDVIIPVFNGEETIKRAIDSVLTQPLELIGRIIIIDDGSHDCTTDIVRAINCDLIYLESWPNSGVAMARNKGIELATSEWIAFLDADDVWDPNKLSVQMTCVNNYKVSLISSKAGIHGKRASGLISCKSMWRGNFIATSSVLMKRAVAQQLTPLFTPKMKFGEDYLAWFKILTIRNGYYVDEPLVKYFVSQAPHYYLISIGWHLLLILQKGIFFTLKMKISRLSKLANVIILTSGVLFSVVSILKRFIKSYY
jgi:glycosyltransferase involved in cell wall biosynthesis